MSNTILVVEDEVYALKLVKLVLQREGYKVVTAENGSEALRLAQEILPDLIVLDIMLPGLDGFQVCQYLRGNPTTAKIPILMFSALSRPADQRKGFEVGTDDYMTKPTKMADLLDRVRSALFFVGAESKVVS